MSWLEFCGFFVTPNFPKLLELATFWLPEVFRINFFAFSSRGSSLTKFIMNVLLSGAL
jgi:hypothetical protein